MVSVMSWSDSQWCRRRDWILLFLLYCLAQLCVRILFGHRMNIDEAETYLWAHHWAWGYGPQPPLYIWLQGAVFHLTGANIFGLALLKELLVFGIFAATFGLASRWTGTTKASFCLAGAVALMLFWLPEFSWESQRLRTHSVLAALISLLAVWQAVRLRAAPTKANHVLLGLLFGLGLLSKWNFAFIVVSIVVVLMLEQDRRLLGWKSLAWFVGVPSLMIFPTTLWVLHHPSVAIASYHKLGVTPSLVWHAALLKFAVSAFVTVFFVILLPVVAFTVFFVFGQATTTDRSVLPADTRDEMRFVMRSSAWALAALLIDGVVIGATKLRYHWLLPILIPVMPVVALRLMIDLSTTARWKLIKCTFAIPVMLLVLMAVTLINLRPVKYFDDSFVVPFLPPNDGRSPYVAKVTMAAHLQEAWPDRVLNDEALLMAGACPDAVTVLETVVLKTAGLETWLVGCGLIAERPSRPLVHGGVNVTVERFIKRPAGGP